MTVIRGNQRTIGVGSRLDALTRLAAVAEDRLPATALDPARDVLRRAADRFGMSAEHTVVVLGGATGVGKSSLFNALVGIGLSPVAVRRPTTTAAIACVWEADRLAEAAPLLDRLGVHERKQLTRDSALDRSAVRDELAGLVLVDLPDHDSAVREHQAEVDQAVGLADVVVWVTDPQKYADASWHDRYLKALAHHADIMLIVLNQTDRLPPEAVTECLADLARIVAADGLAGLPVIPVSARTGAGLDELRGELVGRVSGRRAAADRLAADVDRIAERLAPLLLPAGGADASGVSQGFAAEVPDAVRAEVMEGLRAAAGVSSLADAVSIRLAVRGQAAVSTPLRALAKLRNPQSAQANSRETAASAHTLRELVALVTDSANDVPAPVPVDRAALDTVLDRLADAVVQDIPPNWGRALRERIRESRRLLAERTDAALSACELEVDGAIRHGRSLAGHALCLALAATGAALVLVVGVPRWIGPVLVAAGLIGTVTLDVAARAAARRRAVASGKIAVGQLSVELAAVAQDTLFTPIVQELERYRTAVAEFTVVRGT